MTATFTLTTHYTDTNLVLIPNGAGNMTQLTPSAGANYTCIDDAIGNPDDDTTYVENHAISVASDMYALPNHTTETGTINYIQVTGRAKSHEKTPASSATYKLCVQVGSSATQESTQKNLTNAYSVHKYTLASQPTNSSVWSWNAIDNLQIGVVCSSPSTGDSQTLVLRPNGSGVSTMLSANSPPNYTCVDEAVSDEASTRVTAATAGWWYDAYEHEDHTTETGIITKISLNAVARVISGAQSTNEEFRWCTRTNSVNYTETPFYLTNDWALYSIEYTLNPQTGSAWTWAEVDAVQGGMALYRTIQYPQVTQFYIIVHYFNPENPEMRTTQAYASVNYIPADSNYYFNKPLFIEATNKRTVRTENFWDGTRKTWDVQRSGKGITMRGFEEGSTGSTRMKNLLDILGNEDHISISGMQPYDGDYYIANLGFTREGSQPTIYWWNMTLEEY